MKRTTCKSCALATLEKAIEELDRPQGRSSAWVAASVCALNP